MTVDLDGTEGYATSFLEATFGGLAREFDAAEINRVIKFKSDDEPFLIQEGYVLKTPRGRLLSAKGYEKLGLPAPDSAGNNLF